MQFLSFILIYPIIWLLSILPFKVLYFISDLIYYLIYYVVGYRKKTVFGNLRLAFPDKSQEEITTIAKKFYRHFVDVFGVEMVKSFTMPEKEMAKRYKPINLEIFDELYSRGKSAIIIGAHYANWEWLFNFNLLIKYNVFAVYKKLKNPYFDKKVRETRGRFNTRLISTTKIFSLVKKIEESTDISLYGFIGDQSPRLSKSEHWLEFLGVKVPVHIGVEVLSKKYDLPVIFYAAKKIRRGYYECTLKLLVDDPKKLGKYEITKLFLREVEKQIHETPEHYLWTHKRFKHKDKAPTQGHGEL